ncbi:MAG: sporulation transcriptional regulator SpoIIID [Clostridia bacterium]|nr:sporulation transcriptional regulator SpoIIID [Clostridia bacterium]
MSVDRSKIRCVEIGEFINGKKTTVRKTAEYFGLSKSTVHKDATEKLKIIDHELYDRVRAVLEKNKAERHLRGGEATKIKYQNKITAARLQVNEK